MLELTATVELVGFAPLTADAKDAICGESGVLQLLDDAADALRDDFLGLNDIQGVRIGNDRPNSMHQVVDGDMLVSVIRQVIYTIERASA